jgi:hypothetical protein
MGAEKIASRVHKPTPKFRQYSPVVYTLSQYGPNAFRALSRSEASVRTCAIRAIGSIRA